MRVCPTSILSLALAVLLSSTPEVMSALAGQETSTNQPAGETSTASAENNSTPPASDRQKETPASAPENPPAQTQNGTQNSAQGDQQQPAPEGTAAARSARTIGGPASKPAGSAIAPAKQKRSRSLLIKVGAIAGAGAALGIVYGLTRATPTRPPGAH